MFLTTNRVGSIDPAFKSRIHLSLFYPRLNRETTVTIWKDHLGRIQKQLKDEKKKFEVDKREIIIFAKQHHKDLERNGYSPWNGRQIRNAFQTALALAEYQAEGSTLRLTTKQFMIVAETSSEFDFYLKTVWGGRDDADVAMQDQTRVDKITPEQLRTGSKVPVQAPMSWSRSVPGVPSTSRRQPPGHATSYRLQRRQSMPNESEVTSEEDDDDDDDDEDDDDDSEDEDAVIEPEPSSESEASEEEVERRPVQYVESAGKSKTKSKKSKEKSTERRETTKSSKKSKK